MALNLESKVKLRDGNEIPLLGFGTYELEGKSVAKPVRWALEAGYRHIDSAAWYYNEKECGAAIRAFLNQTGLPRSSVFFTTKLRHNSTYGSVKAAIDKSVRDCGLEYIDLYLLHSAIGGPEARKDTWRAVCDARNEGKLKSIGVSNFGVRHLTEMIDAGVELPVINQLDLHPFMTRTDIVELCKENGIALEAWAPLVRGLRFRHPSITNIAKKYHKEPAQILLRYSLQKGYLPIPKSSLKSRIISNTQIFDYVLTDEEVAHLDTLDEQLVTDWEVTTCP